MKEKPEMLRKVAQVFLRRIRSCKTDPKRGKAIMAKEYPSMTAETNEAGLRDGQPDLDRVTGR